MLTRRLLTGIALGATMLAVTAAGAADGAKPRFAVYGKTLTDTPMAEWDVGGRVNSATGKAEVDKAPKNAVKYTMRMVTWPLKTRA